MNKKQAPKAITYKGAEYRRVEAAVDKVPLFSEFEVTIRPAQIEEMVLQHYPMAVKGTLKLHPKVNDNSEGNRGSYFFNFEMDNADKEDAANQPITGSVIVDSTASEDGIRTYAYIRIDG